MLQSGTQNPGGLVAAVFWVVEERWLYSIGL
jgi:hypothetical protein